MKTNLIVTTNQEFNDYDTLDESFILALAEDEDLHTAIDATPPLTVRKLFDLTIQLLDELPHFANSSETAQQILTLYDIEHS